MNIINNDISKGLGYAFKIPKFIHFETQFLENKAHAVHT